MLTSGWRDWSLTLMLAGVVVAGAGGLAGCSSGSDTSVAPAAPSAVSAAPQAEPVSAAEVATALRKIDQTAKDTAAVTATDKARAASLDGQIEPVWKTIEDTVKQNNQDTYLALEDAYAVLEKAADDGDGASAGKASAAVSSAVQAYLAKYSG